MSRLNADLQSLLSVIELLAIRKAGGNLSITRNENGWTVCLGDPDSEVHAGEGPDLITALENIIVPPKPTPFYIDFKGEPYP